MYNDYFLFVNHLKVPVSIKYAYFNISKILFNLFKKFLIFFTCLFGLVDDFNLVLTLAMLV